MFQAMLIAILQKPQGVGSRFGRITAVALVLVHVPFGISRKLMPANIVHNECATVLRNESGAFGNGCGSSRFPYHCRTALPKLQMTAVTLDW